MRIGLALLFAVVGLGVTAAMACASEIRTPDRTYVDEAYAACRPPGLRRPQSWSVVFAPFGWAASVEGTVVSEGNDSEICTGLDAFTEPSGAFQGVLEIWWKRLFVSLDGTWVDLVDKGSVAQGLVGFETRTERYAFDGVVGSGETASGFSARAPATHGARRTTTVHTRRSPQRAVAQPS